MRAMRGTRLLEVVGFNAIPFVGWYAGGWPPAVALILFWAENAIVTATLAARIRLHDRWTGRQGHDRPHLGVTATTGSGARARTLRFRSFLAEFLTGAIPFVVAHGVVLAAILGGVVAVPIDWNAVRQGVLGLLLVEAAAFAIDLRALAGWPFARLTQRAGHLLGRVVLVQLAIIGGMLFFSVRGTVDSFFGVFLALKFLADLGSLVPRVETTATAATPPRGLAAAMNRLPSRNGETFEQYWARTHVVEAAAAAEDERPRPRRTPR
jgi:hypothetical protein